MDIRIENLSYFCFRKIRWSLRMIMGMKKLLSLPPNFGRLFPCGRACKYRGMVLHLGSGRRPLRIRGRNDLVVGGLPAKRGSGCIDGEWLGQEKRILLHAGGQSRRLPGYAPSGKILTPIPVFSLGKRAEAIPELIVLAITSL